MGDYSNHLHDTYRTILQERGKRTLEPPLWKLRVSDDEYTELQLVLQEAERAGNLPVYGPEAAICYAEWWRRNYHGGFIPVYIKNRQLPDESFQEVFVTG